MADAISSLCWFYHVAETHIGNWVLNTADQSRPAADVLGIAPSGLREGRLDSNSFRFGPSGLIFLAKEVRDAAVRSHKAPTGVKQTIKLLKDAIPKRDECAVWNRGSGDDESDQGHRNYVDAMRVVLVRLEEADKEPHPRRRPNKSKKAGTQKSNSGNVFEELDVEQVGAAFEQSFIEYTPPRPRCKSDELQAKLEPGNGEDDLMLYRFCLEHEKVSNFVSSIWSDIKEEKGLLPHAAVITQAGFGIMEWEAQLLAQDFSAFKSFGNVEPKLKAMSTKETLPAADALLAAWQLVKLFRGYHESHASDMENALHNGHALGRILCKLLPHINYLAEEKRRGRCTLPLDPFTEILLNLVVSKEEHIDIGTVVAFQVQMDIVDTLEGSCIRWFGDRANGPEGMRRADNMSETSSAAAISGELPFCAGWLRWLMEQNAHRAGMAKCERGNVVVSAAHLYHLCRESYRGADSETTTCMPDPWKDMDDFGKTLGLATLGVKHTTAAGTPFLNASKNFGITLGIPIRAYMEIRKEVNKSTFCIHAQPATMRKVSLPLASTFMRCCDKAGVTPKKFPRGKLLPDVLHAVTRSMIKTRRESLNSYIVEQYERTRYLTNVQMLTVLKSSLEEEKHQVAFDYDKFADVCVAVLHVIRSKCEGPGIENMPSFQLVEAMMWHAGTFEARCQESGSDPLNKPEGLLFCAGIMDVMVGGKSEKEGRNSGRQCQEAAQDLIKPSKVMKPDQDNVTAEAAGEALTAEAEKLSLQ